MSRSGYSDDFDGNELAMYRGQVASSIRGKRGQKLLRDFVAALDAMPEKRLGTGALKDENGCMCSLGAVAEARGLDMQDVSFNEWGEINIGHKAFADRFDVASCLSSEIMYENDEGSYHTETPEQRWSRMRAWAVSKLRDGGGNG